MKMVYSYFLSYKTWPHWEEGQTQWPSFSGNTLHLKHYGLNKNVIKKNIPSLYMNMYCISILLLEEQIQFQQRVGELNTNGCNPE